MRRAFAVMMLCCACLCLAAPAAFAVDYLTIEQLVHAQGPATVHVVAKTSEPYNTFGSHLKESSYWYWRVRAENGDFVLCPSIPTFSHADFLKENLSWRSMVLNHKECDLTLYIDENGQITVGPFNTVSRPFALGDSWWVLLVAVILIGGVFFAVRLVNQNGPPVNAEERSNRRLGRLLVFSMILDAFDGWGHRKR